VPFLNRKAPLGSCWFWICHGVEIRSGLRLIRVAGEEFDLACEYHFYSCAVTREQSCMNLLALIHRRQWVDLS
jgi:hypothetical protein